MVLKHHKRAVLQVLHVDSLPGFGYRLWLLEQQPANVRVEEPTLGVVRIFVGIRVTVVKAVVLRPAENKQYGIRYVLTAPLPGGHRRMHREAHAHPKMEPWLEMQVPSIKRNRIGFEASYDLCAHKRCEPAVIETVEMR